MITNNGWSFCIITAPNNEGILQKCINKIHNNFKGIDNYEIVIVGNPMLDEKKLIKTRIISL